MLRRRVHCAVASTATSHTGRCARAPDVLHVAARGGFFDNINEMMKQSSSSSSSSAAGNNNKGSAAGKGDANSPFPPGLDMNKLKTMTDMFNSQPPEKQAQLMKQALDMQKMMSKVPGFKNMSKMNTQVLEEIMRQQQQQQQQPASDSAGAASTAAKPLNPFGGSVSGPSSSSNRGAAPTLDDLKKVNLGPEIEALFEELRSIRKTKNEYRDLFHKEKSRAAAAEESERALRGKLKKAEQEVMLLTSENMEVTEAAKTVKQLTRENKTLQQEIAALRAKMVAGTSAGSPQFQELQSSLRSKEDALRSLGRKVERMRRRDPLLHFSLCCNDITRLCDTKVASPPGATAPVKEIIHAMGGSSGATVSDALAKEAAEERFAELQRSYVAIQQEAWAAAANSNSATTSLDVTASAGGAAARTYIAFLHRLFIARVPYGHLDAIVTVRRSPGADRAAVATHVKALFASVGYTATPHQSGSGAESAEEERWAVTAAATATTRDAMLAPGPFAYAFALRSLSALLSKPSAAEEAAASLLKAGNPNLAAALTTFAVTHAQPTVSDTLVGNRNRVAVAYESARSSGPGGQAVNVAETQIKARLFIDQFPNTAAAGAAASSSSSSSVGAAAAAGGSGDATVTVDGTTLRVLSEDELAAGGDGAASAAAHFAFATEAQDSRSALQNKLSATEKLLGAERRRFNDGPLRSPFGRCEEVEAVLRQALIAEAGEVKVDADTVRWSVAATAGERAVARPLDAALVLAFNHWVSAVQ